MTDREDKILKPLTHTSREFFPFMGALIIIIVMFYYAYVQQLTKGFGLTGLNDIVIWGVYIVNFIFFIGLSHAGIAISAAVRILKLETYRPVARMAEALTLVSLIMAGISIVIDVGRADRVFLMVINYTKRIGTSPLLWDLTAVMTYFVLSSTYFYWPIREDLKHNIERFSGWRRRLYDFLLIGYEPGEERVIERFSWWMAVTILPVMVMVHTTVSWIFSLLSSRPLWFGAVAGPYFIIAAVASGIASVIVIAAIMRYLFDWEELIPNKVFRGLGNFLAVITLVYLYFMLGEQVTARFAGPTGEFFVSESWLFGAYAPIFWLMTLLGMIIPCAALLIQSFRPNRVHVKMTALVSLILVIAFWFKRYMIIVPTLSVAGTAGFYSPTWVELAVSAGLFSLMAFMYTIIMKLVPIMEMKEGMHE